MRRRRVLFLFDRFYFVDCEESYPKSNVKHSTDIFIIEVPTTEMFAGT
jgi:hypothetical protein